MSVFQRRFRVFIKSTKIDSYTSFCIVLIESILIRTSFFLKYFAEIKSKTKTDFFSYRKTLTPQLILYLWQTRTAQSQHDFSAILSASSVTTIASWFELYFRVNSFTVLLVRLEPIPCAFAVLKPGVRSSYGILPYIPVVFEAMKLKLDTCNQLKMCMMNTTIN